MLSVPVRNTNCDLMWIDQKLSLFVSQIAYKHPSSILSNGFEIFLLLSAPDFQSPSLPISSYVYFYSFHSFEAAMISSYTFFQHHRDLHFIKKFVNISIRSCPHIPHISTCLHFLKIIILANFRNL